MGARADERDVPTTVDSEAETMVSGASGERTNRVPRIATDPTMAADVDTELRSAPHPVDARERPLGDVAFSERYLDRRMLGEGGMGEVRLCADLRIGREVAVKVMHPDHETRADMRARFEREARIQGQLEHPSVVPVYELGVRPDGATFFTMKRVRGLTLEEIIEGLRKGDAAITASYGKRRLLSAFGSVCLAVAFAHARGVVHRDLKPANVILGEFGEVYVLDWGVAKLTGVADDEAGQPEPSVDGEIAGLVQDDAPRARTEAGAILGTLGYMAPEQLRGETDRVGPRSDIYALGTMLFELVTGEALHPRHSAQATVVSTLQGADARVSLRPNPWGSAPELDAICQRATELEPEARFPSAREVHDAIERFLDGDRDHEKRRALVEQHLGVAREALREAEANPEKGATERVRAVRALNAALALDPTDKVALRSMVEVLLASSEQLPEEAEAELEASRSRDRKRSARAAAAGFLACFILDPLMAWMGVHSWTALFAMGVPLVAISSFAFYMSTRSQQTPRQYLILGVLAAAFAAVTAPIFGPFVLVPGVVVACMLPLAVNTRAGRGRRAFLVTMGALAIVVPYLLQLAGVLPASYSFARGAITILPWAVEFPGEQVAVFLLAESLAVIIVPMIVIGRSIDALVAAERRLFSQAWTLRQLVPDEAQGAAVAGMGGPEELDDDDECVLQSGCAKC